MFFFYAIVLYRVLQTLGSNVDIIQNNVRALNSSSVLLECNRETMARNKWKHNGRIIFTGNNAIGAYLRGSISIEQNYSLRIDPVSLWHEGLYECIRNATTAEMYNVTVEVQPDINISVNGSNATTEAVFQDGRIVAQCAAHKAKPAVNLSWLINDDLVASPKAECISSQSGTNKTYDCTSNFNTKTNRKNGTLTCMTKGDFSFRTQNASVIFYVLDPYNKTPENQTKSGTEVVFPAIWPIGFLSVPFFLGVGIGLHWYLKKKKSEPLELPPRNPSRSTADYPNDADGRYQTPLQAYATVQSSDIPDIHLVSHHEGMSPIDEQNIALADKLPGDGYFDCWIASVARQDTKVVAKSLKANSHLSDLYMFQDVADAITSLVYHQNIAQVLGASVVQVPYYIYQEFIEQGTLREFLLSNYQSPRYSYLENSTETDNCSADQNNIHDLACFSFQISEGMTFLIDKKFTHPALSADKVLVHSNGSCKLYDFWPEKFLKFRIDNIFSKENVPIAWLAPETIFFRQHSSESDVWSFAIVLWEIYSLGEIPYRGLTNDDIEATIRKSCLLDRPLNCPGGIFNLMLSSWNLSMKDRPSFHQLREKLMTFGANPSKLQHPVDVHPSTSQYSTVNK